MEIDSRLVPYAERLFKEWHLHNNLIIGVDYDNSIATYHTFKNDEDIDRTIQLLKDCKKVGCTIVIHTSCNPDRHDEIKAFCKSIGLEIATINETPLGAEFPYGKPGSKPYCNHYLDDRAALPASLDVLELAMYKMITSRNAHFSKDGVA